MLHRMLRVASCASHARAQQAASYAIVSAASLRYVGNTVPGMDTENVITHHVMLAAARALPPYAAPLRGAYGAVAPRL